MPSAMVVVSIKGNKYYVDSIKNDSRLPGMLGMLKKFA